MCQHSTCTTRRPPAGVVDDITAVIIKCGATALFVRCAAQRAACWPELLAPHCVTLLALTPPPPHPPVQVQVGAQRRGAGRV